MTCLAIFGGLVLLTLIGLPIAFAMGAVGLFGVFFSQLPLMSVPLLVIKSAETYVLTAVPMFMLMGLLVEKAGLGKIIIDFAASMVGWLRGGLAHVNVIDSLIFGGISGSSASDVASLGTIIIPEMTKRGYPRNFAAAITSSTAELAVLIPPSIPAIVYGVLANVSIAKMFLAGIIPGLVLAGLFMAINHVMAVRNNWPVQEPFSLSRAVRLGVKAAPALTIPIIILGGILGGIFTATESAAITVGIAAALTFVVYRTVSWSETWELLVLTCRRTAVIMLIVAASGTLGWYLADRQVPQELATQLLTLTTSPTLIRILLGLFLVLLGTMMSGMAMMILMVPVMMPILPMIGMDPIQYGVVLVVAGAVGSQTPPVAATMLLTCVIGEVTVEEMWQANRWFVLATTVLLFLVLFIPELSLTLPRLLG